MINEYNPVIEKVDDIFYNNEYNKVDELNVVAYSENVQAFTSFYSTDPNWVIDMYNDLYSIDKYNMLRIHNRKAQYDKSLVRFVVNKHPNITKCFDNVEYSAKFTPSSENFTRVYFSTNTMESKDVPLIGLREDNYRFAVPRTITNERNFYPNRMKGRYMISNYEFDNPNSYFKVPSVTTKFRQTFI
jgi:hypothetical protein